MSNSSVKTVPGSGDSSGGPSVPAPLLQRGRDRRHWASPPSPTACPQPSPRLRSSSGLLAPFVYTERSRERLEAGSSFTALNSCPDELITRVHQLSQGRGHLRVCFMGKRDGPQTAIRNFILNNSFVNLISLYSHSEYIYFLLLFLIAQTFPAGRSEQCRILRQPSSASRAHLPQANISMLCWCCSSNRGPQPLPSCTQQHRDPQPPMSRTKNHRSIKLEGDL